MLCSPNQNQSNYYLLKSEDHNFYSTSDLDGQGKNCQYAKDDGTLGEKLEIKVEQSQLGRAVSLPKAIVLSGCQIKDLRTESNQLISSDPKPSLELSCKEQWGSQTVKIFDKGLEFLKR